MEKERMIVVNLKELASRWQIPVARVEYLITDCGMPMDDSQGEWFATHSDLILSEKQKAFDDSLFPRKFRPEPSKSSA